MELTFFRTTKGKIILWGIFLVYLLFLIRVILLKYPVDMIVTILNSNGTVPLQFRIENSNFIPGKTILNYITASPSTEIAIQNIFGNIVAFGPFGFLMPIILNKTKIYKHTILSAAMLSLVFEVIQLLTGIGEFDVDDIILNVIGGICGYIVHLMFDRWITKK